MLEDRPSTTAELLAQHGRRLSRLEHVDRGDSAVRVVRSISDTTESDDTVSATVEDTDTGFIIGTSRIGRDSL